MVVNKISRNKGYITNVVMCTIEFGIALDIVNIVWCGEKEEEI